MDQIAGADVQIFPIGQNPVEYPEWVGSPLPYINAAIENGKKIMLIAPRAMNYAFADVQGDDQTGQVIFKGEEVAPADMSVDQARATVDRMAKRATNKRL